MPRILLLRIQVVKLTVVLHAGGEIEASPPMRSTHKQSYRGWKIITLNVTLIHVYFYFYCETQNMRAMLISLRFCRLRAGGRASPELHKGMLPVLAMSWKRRPPKPIGRLGHAFRPPAPFPPSSLSSVSAVVQHQS